MQITGIHQKYSASTRASTLKLSTSTSTEIKY